ncbi:MAG: hypothetical protein K6G83_09950 [Lachnospiraceae bacterium]|nr:hypothetical protein [Lachnospiraceae bacterium]
MSKDTWNSLSFFEQLSNIDGDVERLNHAHEKYINKASEKDNGYFYLDKIKKMIKMILFDPKNSARGYRAIELYDEAEEPRKYLEGEYSADYIRSYWNSYTKALS